MFFFAFFLVTFGSIPHPVTVANEGCLLGSLAKNVTVLVVTVAGCGARSRVTLTKILRTLVFLHE